MFSPGGALIASATAAALGGIAELPVQTITEAGEYRFVVTGAVTGTGDSYTFYKVFNGMNDLDSLNTRTSVARNIDALFVPLDGDASFAWVQRQVNLLSTRNYVYSMTLSAGDALSVLYDPGSSSSTSRVTDPTGTTLAQDAAAWRIDRSGATPRRRTAFTWFASTRRARSMRCSASTSTFAPKPRPATPGRCR